MAVFRNSYLIMRHGQSEANVARVIVSDPAIGCERFGLTQQGSKQVIASALKHKGEGITQVICSDFLRTQQTAKLVIDTLGLPSSQPKTGLRERFFGCWEGKSDEHYQDIWEHDLLNGHPASNRVESAEAVFERGFKVLKRLEQHYENQVILLVSHGDMLQILRTAFVGELPKLHRSLSHHETAEIKQLVSQGDECPV